MTSPHHWQNLAATLHADGLVDSHAFHLAGVVARMCDNPVDADAAFLAAFLVAQHQAATGETCLPASTSANATLAQFLAPGKNAPPAADAKAPPGLFECLPQNVCGNPAGPPRGQAPAPLVLDNGNLYLHRDWAAENNVAGWFRAENPARENHACALRFTAPGFSLSGEQRRAVHAALSRRVSLITGGPGTGKTTIVAFILLARLLENPGLRIQLCAPTGKARLRMREALAGVLATRLLPVHDGEGRDLRGTLLKTPSSTLHRLLGWNPLDGVFRHNAANPLRLDVLVVDETSMIDLHLMDALLGAIPPSADVVFLGDPDQLPAVETGAILAGLAAAWDGNPAHARLARSHRFDPSKGIGQLKESIRQNDPGAAWRVLQAATGALSCQPPVTGAGQLPARLKKLLASPGLKDFREYPRAPNLREAFARFDTFRVLCAAHDGPSGVDAFNAAFRELLNIPAHGRGDPLMATQNDPANGLCNGDTGLCWDDGNVHFPDPEKPGGFRVFSPRALTGLVPAFAITVHKSQGSDFDGVLVALPGTHTPLLTRELLYTAVTRARGHCALWATRGVLAATIQNTPRRAAGFLEKLRA